MTAPTLSGLPVGSVAATLPVEDAGLAARVAAVDRRLARCPGVIGQQAVAGEMVAAEIGIVLEEIVPDEAVGRHRQPADVAIELEDRPTANSGNRRGGGRRSASAESLTRRMLLSYRTSPVAVTTRPFWTAAGVPSGGRSAGNRAPPEPPTRRDQQDGGRR